MNTLNTKAIDDKRRAILVSIIEGRKMESYAEHQTKEMHVCWLCDTICYKKRPVKKIGARWVCLNCIQELKEVLDTLKQWEEEHALQGEVKKQLDTGLDKGLQ